ncbi:hypothetical protein KI387_028635, partial [Taxus chinensis]
DRTVQYQAVPSFKKGEPSRASKTPFHLFSLSPLIEAPIQRALSETSDKGRK